MDTLTTLQIRLASLAKTRSALLGIHKVIMRQIDEVDKERWQLRQAIKNR